MPNVLYDRCIERFVFDLLLNDGATDSIRSGDEDEVAAITLIQFPIISFIK